MNIRNSISTSLESLCLPEKSKIILASYFIWLGLFFIYFLLCIGLNYVYTNLSSGLVEAVLFVVTLFVNLGVYIMFMATVFFTFVTIAIMISLALISKIFYGDNRSLFRLSLIKLEDIVTMKRYLLIYVIMFFVIIILADNNVFGLRDLF